jgi:hypothetical protein
MSRLHVRFDRCASSVPESDLIEYSVRSPDFSADPSAEWKNLGKVTVVRSKSTYEFEPSKLWSELGFIDQNRLARGDPSISPESRVEGIGYAVRIHRAISSMIQDGDFI